MTEWQMYWLLALDNIRSTLMGAIIVGIIITIVGFITGAFSRAIAEQDKSWYPKDAATAKRFSAWCFRVTRWLAFATVPFILLWTFVPSTKQMAAIIVVPKLVLAVESNERIQFLPDKLLDLTDSWIDDLTPISEDDAAEEQ